MVAAASIACITNPERRIGRSQVRGEPAFVADIGIVTGIVQFATQRVEDFRTPMRIASAQPRARPA